MSADLKVTWVYEPNNYGGYFRTLDLTCFANDPQGKRRCLIENGVLEDKKTLGTLMQELGFVKGGIIEVPGKIAFPGGQFASTGECVFYLPNFPESGQRVIASKSKETFRLFMEGMTSDTDFDEYMSEFAKKRMRTIPKEIIFQVTGYSDPNANDSLIGQSFVLAKQELGVYKAGANWRLLESDDLQKTSLSVAIM